MLAEIAWGLKQLGRNLGLNLKEHIFDRCLSDEIERLDNLKYFNYLMLI